MAQSSKVEQNVKKIIAMIQEAGLSYYVTAPQDFISKHPLGRMRVVFTDGDAKTRKIWQDRLRVPGNADIEAMLVYEYAKQDKDLMDVIEERAAIRKYEARLSGDVIEAIKSYF